MNDSTPFYYWIACGVEITVGFLLLCDQIHPPLAFSLGSAAAGIILGSWAEWVCNRPQQRIMPDEFRTKLPPECTPELGDSPSFDDADDSADFSTGS